MGVGGREALHLAVPAHNHAVSMKKKSLQLLGVWNELPFSVWVWHCDAAKKHFYDLTSRYVHTFIYTKDELSYQCFLTDTLELLKYDFERLKSREQMRYVGRITKDYYKRVKPFERYINKYRAARFRSFTDAQLIRAVREMVRVFPPLTMQAWYSVLIDIWYPSSEQRVSVKRVIGGSRDHLGRLHAHSAKIDDVLLREIGRRSHQNLHGMYYLFPEEVIQILEGKHVSDVVLH